MNQYPILFGYKDLIAGNGFTAGVAVDGRALIIEEDDGVWVHSVTPGGISADGDSQKEAAAEFRAMYRAALYDIAAEARDFDGFRLQVEQFFNDENRVLAESWETAVEEVRSGKVGSDWLEKQPADSPRSVRVVHLTEEKRPPDPSVRRPQPSFNQPDRASLAAA